jgi:hypothetical protein
MPPIYALFILFIYTQLPTPNGTCIELKNKLGTFLFFREKVGGCSMSFTLFHFSNCKKIKFSYLLEIKDRQ